MSGWGKKYPTIAPLWRRHWEQITPFMTYPLDIRRSIYTTNALESVHMRLRKIIKNRGHFPNDDAAAEASYPSPSIFGQLSGGFRKRSSSG
jgi:transposase-like protein